MSHWRVFPSEKLHGVERLTISPGDATRVVFVSINGYDGESRVWLSVTPKVAQEIAEAFQDCAEMAGQNEVIF